MKWNVSVQWEMYLCWCVVTRPYEQMRIVCKHICTRQNAVRYQSLPLSATQCYSVSDVETLLEKHCDVDGKLNSLFIDFSGEYIPIIHRDELHLVSALACAYHNSTIRANIQVSSR